jgi:hypothetical protein
MIEQKDREFGEAEGQIVTKYYNKEPLFIVTRLPCEQNVCISSEINSQSTHLEGIGISRLHTITHFAIRHLWWMSANILAFTGVDGKFRRLILPMPVTSDVIWSGSLG